MNYDDHLERETELHYDDTQTEVRYEILISDSVSPIVNETDLTEDEVDELLQDHGVKPRNYDENYTNLWEDNGLIIQLDPEIRFSGDFI